MSLNSIMKDERKNYLGSIDIARIAKVYFVTYSL